MVLYLIRRLRKTLTCTDVIVLKSANTVVITKITYLKKINIEY